MTPSELERFARILRAQREERVADAAALTSSLDEVLAARSDGTADDEHDPDGSTLSSDWSQLAGLSAASRQRIAEIEHALGRVAIGTYGECAGCGALIPVARLEARPSAERCLSCAG